VKSKLIDKLANCECCPWKCGVNRLEKETGICGISSDIVVSHSGLHFGEEPPISGSNGSGTIFFAGCNLKCVFCQNFQISQEFIGSDYKIFSKEELSDEMIRLQDSGAHNINFVSPSHMICRIADSIIFAKNRGLNIPIVYNTNGYDSVEVLKEIDGLIDIYLPDMKYMKNDPAKKYSLADNYVEVATSSVKEMYRQVGNLETDKNGIAISGILVRHLVLPGSVDNSKAVMEFLAGLSGEMFISVMSQYSPCYKADNYPEISRVVNTSEYDEIVGFAVKLGLKNLFLQELESQSEYIPDFSQESPFKNR